MPPKSEYDGHKVILTTKHGKDKAIARPTWQALRAVVEVCPQIDTDVLGTFSGEVERVGTPREVALKKARLGLNLTGARLGVANEGSFGPHPAFPWIPSDHELLVFIDRDRDIEISEGLLTEVTNYAQCQARRIDDLTQFLERALFPSHALIVRPRHGNGPGLLFKGITDLQSLRAAISQCASASEDGLAHVETDMRAHLNPTRMRMIRRLAHRFARRIATACPCCQTPGWGQIRAKRGLPCRACGEPTELVVNEILGCVRCDFILPKPRRDGKREADESACPICNP